MALSLFNVSRVSAVVVHGSVVAVAGLVLLSRAACIDGATPNCAGDAGCGPGIEASQLIDASTDVADGKATDAVSDAAIDAPVDGPTDDAAPVDAASDAASDTGTPASDAPKSG